MEHNSVEDGLAQNSTVDKISTGESKCGKDVFKPKLACVTI